MKDHILFDTTDANTIADSDKILSGMVSSSDGATLITDTLVSGKQGLDVYVINPVTVTGGAEKAEDSAHSSGDTGSFALAVRNDTEGTLVDTDGDYAPLQVDASGRLRVIADVDVSNQSEKNEDDAHSSGDTGSFVLTVRQDTLATSTSADGDYAAFKVNAVGELYTTDEGAEALLTTIDADTGGILTNTATIAGDTTSIDATLTGLSHLEDDAHASGDAGLQMLQVRQDTLATSTSADGDYGSIKGNAKGEIYVIDTDGNALLTTIDADTSTIAGDTTSIDATLTALSHAEDSAHSSGDQGQMALAVRNDTLGSLVDTDGDYAPLQVNASGELYVTLSTAIDTNDTANTAIANAVNTMTVASTAEDVVASPLANRKYLFAYNNGNKKAYFGASGVTIANGFPLSPGSVLELRAGAAIDIEWVAIDTAQEIRTLELS